MSHRVDFHRERLVEHLTEREWSEEDIAHFTHMVGHSALLSSEAALSVLEFQQSTDERIQAEKDFDATFNPQEGWDDMGTYYQPMVLERTDEVNNHFQQRFRNIQ